MGTSTSVEPEVAGRRRSISELAEAARHCTACELYRAATQTVFGEGSSRASIMLLGEQPGDQEDRAGEPFVGPAGGLLDRALESAGIPRREVYITNAVKHFRFEMRGKRRLHEKPARRHILACRPWLEAELAAIDPEVVVCLGASAAEAILDRRVAVMSIHGEELAWEGRIVVPTIHPSYALRSSDAAERERRYGILVADLEVALAAARDRAARA